ncbi:uncharacterized protein BDW43DRAFT_310230 [Aspergillus alliaceus]|uniref:uncharacterized protein n=1 Tax=Petromyces alliaceus TaxID=209559 RepID=UPI0012A3C65E|nr:uncharacterized protein BDW43DRAFT_310230 [Aspergillus alliaceus]KAB8234568.1 hypothetical protein BDW43DRAFT_310230 [Aspergillus alliaceus]
MAQRYYPPTNTTFHIDEDFLCPRDLLLEDGFILKGPLFKNFNSAFSAFLYFPLTKVVAAAFFRFTDRGAKAIEGSIGMTVTHLGKIHDQYKDLYTGYKQIGTICNIILDLAKTAQEDYDVIFDGLERLYRGESDEELRALVQARINKRLGSLTTLTSKTREVRSKLIKATRDVEISQDELKDAAKDLNRWEVFALLREAIKDDNEYQLNFWALINMKVNLTPIGWAYSVYPVLRAAGLTKHDHIQIWVFALTFTGPAAGALHDLERALGSIELLDLDLVTLERYVKELVPGENPFERLRKGKILAKWASLEKEVKVFKEQYIDPA